MSARVLCDCGQQVFWTPDLEDPERSEETGEVFWKNDMASVVLLRDEEQELPEWYDIYCDVHGQLDFQDVRAAIEHNLHMVFREEPTRQEPEQWTSGSAALDELIFRIRDQVLEERPDFTEEVARLWAIEIAKEMIGGKISPKSEPNHQGGSL